MKILVTVSLLISFVLFQISIWSINDSFSLKAGLSGVAFLLAGYLVGFVYFVILKPDSPDLRS